MNGIAMHATDKSRHQSDIVERHEPLVKGIAYHLINRLPASVQLEDLIQAQQEQMKISYLSIAKHL